MTKNTLIDDPKSFLIFLFVTLVVIYIFRRFTPPPNVLGSDVSDADRPLADRIEPSVPGRGPRKSEELRRLEARQREAMSRAAVVSGDGGAIDRSREEGRERVRAPGLTAGGGVATRPSQPNASTPVATPPISPPVAALSLAIPPDSAAALLRAERALQDAEYAAAVATDAAMRRRIPSSPRRSSQVSSSSTSVADPALEQKRLEKEAQVARQLSLDRWRKETLSSLRPAPLEADSTSINVCVRLPNGSRVSRSFDSASKVMDVYTWVSTLDFEGATRWVTENTERRHDREQISGAPTIGDFILLLPGNSDPVCKETQLSKIGKRVLFIIDK